MVCQNHKPQSLIILGALDPAVFLNPVYTIRVSHSQVLSRLRKGGTRVRSTRRRSRGVIYPPSIQTTDDLDLKGRMEDGTKSARTG
ncbi:hypothetical protein PAXRUDRAFT_829789 [Paxillus rubicundulus Ve08.2h10]|uniref:Uncharacterized protein n=1 Tax=Paxillus rubicundulus Ve08.2h10 TaxID=930991 RepID=A0A0D0DUD5_9AGAM|nr:hypothetical protein PAXRUDRAFT_829789 [Paxillus rubicundulus Ve08.2h10]